MKKKMMIIGALLLMAFGVYQGTMAVHHEETNLQSPITAGKLGIEILNSSNENSNNITLGKVMPGSEVKEPILIQNVKQKDLYVRVTLSRYWTDENGKKIINANASYIQPMLGDAENWIIIDDGENSNNEVIYFYYKLPMKANEKSTIMIDGIKFDMNIKDPVYTTYKASVKLEAEAIQTIGAEDAILSQWGMEVNFDDAGNIQQVNE